MTAVLVTGATDGIGKATALALAAQGARVLVHGRSRDKVDHVVGLLTATQPGNHEGVVADLGSLAAVRTMARELGQRLTSLDVLLNNAGVFAKERRATSDGFELTIGINHVAHFVLTQELLPLLRAARGARVVTVSSVAHRRAEDELADPNLDTGWQGYRAYAWSKLANIWFSSALARRVVDDGITANSLHPGVIGTKLLRAGFGIDGSSTDEGSRTSVRLALDPTLARVSGRYFRDEQEMAPSELALDPNRQERLWAWTEAATR